MKRTLMKSGLSKKYTVAFYGIMLLLAAGLTILMLYFASEKFVNYELSSIMDAETQAANDVEMQHGVMRDVVAQIRASSEYRPSVLNTTRYRDIELLNDFNVSATIPHLSNRIFCYTKIPTACIHQKATSPIMSFTLHPHSG